MDPAFYSLDEPRVLSTRARVVTSIAFVVYALIVAAAFVEAQVSLLPNPGFALAHALVGAIMCAVTALLLVVHASSTGRRGYLAVAATFWYLALVLLAFPLFFPNVFVTGRPLWGGPPSATDLFYACHFVFPLGVAASAWIIYRDQLTARRPDLSQRTITWVSVVTTLAALGTILLAAYGWDLLPSTVSSSGDSLSDYGHFLSQVLTVLTVACFGITAYCARTGSLISWWLAALSLLLVGEALVNAPSTTRFTEGWYSGRILWLVCLTMLLVALIWNLARVDRANTVLAKFDSATGCMSRLSLVATLKQEIARLRTTQDRLAVLWIDIDNFKGINDQLGHRVGDDVLRQLVDRISQQIRDGDHLGRLGGDEFGVLLSDDVDRERTAAVAQRILASIREPFRSGGNLIHLTVSVGGALAPDDAVTPESLLLCADLAMYASKNRAGDRFDWFEPAIGVQAMERAKLRQDLTAAIADHDFCLYYQPIFEVETLRMAGVEALVRWSRSGEIVNAGAFVPGAEQSGQIVAIGRQVIEMIAQDMPIWLREAPSDFFVSLNLSVKELADKELVETLITHVGDRHSDRVVVELTESLELEGDDDAQTNLERLRLAGIRPAIDDFGTGFSNFTRLERLQPTILKVDRSLVQKAAAQPMADRTFLTAATSVAATLHCDVVAEGVDNEASMQVIRQPGIRYVQGFSFGVPAPMQEYLELAARTR